MADEIDNESLPYFGRKTFVFQKQINIEEIPWVLTIKGSTDLAGVQIKF